MLVRRVLPGKVGVERHRAFLSRLQLLGRLKRKAGNAGLPLQPVQNGDWRTVFLWPMAIACRCPPLQLASSAMALFNGGNLVQPDLFCCVTKARL